MEALLVKYGYLLLFGGVIVEGEAFLLTGAYLAHRGLFSLPTVVAVAIAATMFADHVYYHAARARGRAWLERRKGVRGRYNRVIDLAARRGPWLLLVSRYAFGFRIVIPAACGAVGMPAGFFTFVDFVAVSVWAALTVLLGYYGGAAVAGYLHDFKQIVVWLAVAAVLCVAAVISFRGMTREARLKELGMADVHAVMPFVMSLLGVANIAAALWPHASATQAISRHLPLEVGHGSRMAMLFAGLALLQVTRNLARRKEAAWWVAVLALSLSFVSHLGPELDLLPTLVSGLLLAYLLAFRRRFHALSDPATLRRALVMVPVLGAVVVAYGWLGLTSLGLHFVWPPGAAPLREAVRDGILIEAPLVQPAEAEAARFLNSLAATGWLARLYLLVLLLRPVVVRGRQEAPPEVVADLRRSCGRRSLSAFAARADKQHLLVAGERGLVAFAVRHSVAIACGGPLAPPDALQESIRDFVQRCRRNGWTPAFYGVPEEDVPFYERAELKLLPIAQEAVIPLPEVGVPAAGPEALAARLAEARAAGLSVRRYDRAEAPEPLLDEQLEEVSEAWLMQRRLGELRFSLGSFSLEELDGNPVFVCESEGRVEAFCSWLSYAAGRAVVLDLLRKRPGAAGGCRELLLAESLAAHAAAGLDEASFGIISVSRPESLETPAKGKRRLARFLHRLSATYGYNDLFTLKDAFGPRWESRYLAFPSDRSLPRVALALADVHTTRGLRQLLRG
jgi:phosphatidylglycerol lysyltransferase